MTVTFELPDQLEHDLKDLIGDVNGKAKEAFLVELYRTGVISGPVLCAALGMDRIELERLLHQYQVTEDLGSLDDYLSDARQLHNLRAGR